jgi:hypothetical protein
MPDFLGSVLLKYVNNFRSLSDNPLLLVNACGQFLYTYRQMFALTQGITKLGPAGCSDPASVGQVLPANHALFPKKDGMCYEYSAISFRPANQSGCLSDSGPP